MNRHESERDVWLLAAPLHASLLLNPTPRTGDTARLRVVSKKHALLIPENVLSSRFQLITTPNPVFSPVQCALISRISLCGRGCFSNESQRSLGPFTANHRDGAAQRSR